MTNQYYNDDMSMSKSKSSSIFDNNLELHVIVYKLISFTSHKNEIRFKLIYDVIFK